MTYIRQVGNFVLSDLHGVRIDGVGDAFGSWATVGYIILDAKISIWSTGVVTRRKNNSTY